jgi:hypothetical protein
MREAVEGIGALEHSQIRDVEALDVHFHHDTFEEHVKALEVWRAEMPEEAANCRVFKGSEAAKVLSFLRIFFLFLSQLKTCGDRCSKFLKRWSASSPIRRVPPTHIVP